MNKQKLLNISVSNMSMDEALMNIEKMIDSNQKSYIVAVNIDVVLKIEEDPYLKEIVNNANMVLVDGQPLVWIAKLYRNPIKEKISGSDLVPLLCERAAKRGNSVFILGGKEGAADKAKQNLEKCYKKIKIVGTYSPSFDFENDQQELKQINALISEAHPDLLISCLGCPKQEKWIYDNMKDYDAKVSVCAGATVDFLAGNVNRAPRWMSNHGLEWFYRFLQEPRRLFKRYFIDDLKIVKLIWKYRNSDPEGEVK